MKLFFRAHVTCSFLSLLSCTGEQIGSSNDSDSTDNNDADIDADDSADSDTDTTVGSTDMEYADTQPDTTVDVDTDPMLLVPEDYSVIYHRNFNSEQSASDYLNTDAWYFYCACGGGVTDRTHPELQKRFRILSAPDNPENGALFMTKFDGDYDDNPNFWLNPRTELSFRPSVERSSAREIYFHLRTWFPASQAGVFSAEFVQFFMHGSEDIPLQIEVRNGVFAARNPRTNGYQTPFEGKNLNDYLERWITWEVRAKFNNDGGYWDIFMDGEPVFSQTASMVTWPGNTGSWHPQFGMYANNGGVGQMEAYFDDFIVAERDN